MDFTWGKIESKCGEYNFSSYDTLLATMEAHGVQPYWILDYGNPCYPPIPDAACKTEVRFFPSFIFHAKISLDLRRRCGIAED